MFSFLHYCELPLPRIAALLWSFQKDQAGVDYQVLISSVQPPLTSAHTHTHTQVSSSWHGSGDHLHIYGLVLHRSEGDRSSAAMCDQTFMAATFGPCDSCGKASPLMNIYIKSEAINYCSFCVEMVMLSLSLLQQQTAAGEFCSNSNSF